ncbi:hypothetical protein LRS03_12270 [Rhizobacter sp. J219]|jgi:uncharacterized membrane protein|uniref:DUF4870 family protein n=1 Tax=Rhizobacter sp. J219 TaxID=2898430 RepID=UPI00215085F3|nr:hypothetical protein [Rhizobacter sp. J219]MCR5883585.1 hypothetical protein [Rhizobacter sp. J219]
MNEALTGDSEKLASLKQLTMVTYILYALSAFTGVTAIVAIVINYVKRDDAAGTLYESHFTWQIRTFWWSLLWFVVGCMLAIVGVGVVILIADGIWVIYRIVKGFLYWNDGKPMDVK